MMREGLPEEAAPFVFGGERADRTELLRKRLIVRKISKRLDAGFGKMV